MCTHERSTGPVFDPEEIDVVTSLAGAFQDRDSRSVCLVSPLNFYAIESLDLAVVL